jgi:hypothetical protein
VPPSVLCSLCSLGSQYITFDPSRPAVTVKFEERRQDLDHLLAPSAPRPTPLAGAKSPGEDKKSNWLPGPNGTFSLYMRAYWSDKTILDGQWKPPAVKKFQ